MTVPTENISNTVLLRSLPLTPPDPTWPMLIATTSVITADEQVELWIFNPGSPEAVSTIEHSFQRGIFLVTIHRDENQKQFSTKVRVVKLKNRSYLWRTVCIPNGFKFRNSSQFNDFIVRNLCNSLPPDHLKNRIELHEKPILYLKLTGRDQFNSRKIAAKILAEKIKDELQFLQVKIFEKFTKPTTTLMNYLLTK